MVDIRKELRKELTNLTYREIDVSLESLFPRLNRQNAEIIARQYDGGNKHQTVLNLASGLLDGGYGLILDKNGFWDEQYPTFSGHCHQITPVLGLMLKSLDFDVSYLECFRVRDHFMQTGRVEQVPPIEESNEKTRDEFCGIGRIPYCCLEVVIDGQPFYISGKHIKVDESKNVEALLTPECYREFVGVFPHQRDNSKSGIYLRTLTPKGNPDDVDFSSEVVWMKQTREPSPELFKAFLRMKLH